MRKLTFILLLTLDQPALAEQSVVGIGKATAAVVDGCMTSYGRHKMAVNEAKIMAEKDAVEKCNQRQIEQISDWVVSQECQPLEFIFYTIKSDFRCVE